MTDPKSFENDDEIEHVEFPYPKLVKLFDFYFPRTKGYKKIDWRKILRVWSRWAPWVTLFQLILLFWFFITKEEWVAGIAFCGLIISLVNFAYYLILAAIAKWIKRSPQVLLALTPRASFAFLIIVLIFQLGTWLTEDENARQRRLARESAMHSTSEHVQPQTQPVKP